MRPEDIARLADLIVQCVGTRSLLNVHGDADALAPALWRRGADVRDTRITDTAPVRPDVASAAFDTVVFQADPSMIYDDRARAVVRELHRVTRGALFLWFWCPPQQGHDAANARRLWWEDLAFEAGFRKHPAYYRVNDYEALNRDGPLVCVPLEKLPDEAMGEYPLGELADEGGPRIDMLRDAGERSDAHAVRYDWACRYVRPGDRVLDAGCGPGYGCHLVKRLTDAASVLGIDPSGHAIEYARRTYGDDGRGARFETGILSRTGWEYEDGSFDTIISFGTLEKADDPAAVLREFRRLLAPGGRILVSALNDRGGRAAPDIGQRHPFDWARLRREIEQDFVLDEAFAQTSGAGLRVLARVPIVDDAPTDCEWWLMAAMKTPLAARQPYAERVFANIAGSGHPSVDYTSHFENPWLMHAMVNVTYRLRNGAALEDLATHVMVSAPTDSSDYAAALCVKAYRVVDRAPENPEEADDLVELIKTVVARPPAGPMGLRWKVSLLFVGARLYQAMGRLAEARAMFGECAGHDVRAFGIHLSTRVSEAWFLAGKLAYSLGDNEDARRNWEGGVRYGEKLLSTSLDAILIDAAFPNRFNHGDGVREYTVAWDNVARCANGLHLLRRGDTIDDAALENCFQTEYAVVLRELLIAREHLVERDDQLIETRRLLVERTERLESAVGDLAVRTDEVASERRLLVERTMQAEAIDRELRKRTEELIGVRALLHERTGLLEGALAGLPDVARELVHTREELVDRTARLETTASELVARTRELEITRADLQDRTARLEALHVELDHRKEDLAHAHEAAAAVQRDLEHTRRSLKSRDDELVRANKGLAERTGQFHAATFQLHHRTKELQEAADLLAEHTSRAEALARELETRTRDLVETRQLLAERTERLEALDAELRERTRVLEDLVGTLRAIRAAPFQHALKGLFRKD